MRSRMRPFLLRRAEEQVAAELPARTEQVLSVELDPRHRQAQGRAMTTLLTKRTRSHFPRCRTCEKA
ncbi:hypothetical protein [Actinomyces bowdenii]|uniref:hypothetical protein n=1 Tax=Actinomyces bowdenii TaxID=131109 RepID=UPI002443DA37|nr:hypothetical protein [Actinomyces bowdenii]